jgi:hypothetical protein
MDDMARDIEALIARNGTAYAEKPDWETHYSADIIERFKETVHILRQATEMVERIDYVVSADDSEESFRERWSKEVRPYWGTEVSVTDIPPTE